MDSISALLRPISKDDELRALADGLRKRKRAADFYSLSTIKPLQALGQSAGSEVMESAQRQGVLREALARRKSDEEEKRLGREWRSEESALDRQSREEIARMLADSRTEIAGMKGGGYNEPKTQKEREAFEKEGAELATFNGIVSAFKPEYGVGSDDIPLTGGITNFIGRKFEGMAPDDWKEKAQWWSSYKQNAELVRKHELFGSALTKNEQKQWEEAMIGADDGPEYIERKLNIQRDLSNKVAEYAAARALQKNYDPRQVMLNYGDVVDVEALAQSVYDGSYFENLSRRQAESRESKKAEPTEWSDEMEEELRQLEAELNGANP